MKKIILKLSPLVIVLFSLLPFYKVSAQFAAIPGTTLYGPMQSTGSIIVSFLIFLTIFVLMPLVVVIGIAVYIFKKRKKSNDKKNTETGKP